jgi:two-component system, LuxR family, response regulator FixJ
LVNSEEYDRTFLSTSRETQSMSEKAIVHVIEDDASMRESLVDLLSASDFDVQSYPSATDYLTRGTFAGPGCIVSDVRMPEIDGITLCRKLREKHCTLPLILMTAHADVSMAVAAMKAGAVDFLEKPFDAPDLLKAVRMASSRPFNRRASDRGSGEATRKLQQLTTREQEVLVHLVAGDSNKSAAQKLGVSPRTVEFHRAHIMDKVSAKGLPDLVRLWLAAHPER